MPHLKRNYPIIIGGFYRSGTTLFRRLIDSHSRIHCGPEVKFFEDYFGNYIHDVLAHKRFFRTAHLLGIDDDLFRIFGNAFVDIHRCAAKKNKKKRWADKNPENLMYLKEWHSLLRGRFIFVHLVRHPLDALASLIEVGFPLTVPESFEDKVQLYEKFIKNALDYSDSYPERCFVIRYEDLVRNTEEVLIDFMKKIGEEFENNMLTEYLDDERRNGIEDPKVLKRTNIDDSSIGRWVNEFNSQQIEYAKEKLEHHFYAFGYKHSDFVH